MNSPANAAILLLVLLLSSLSFADAESETAKPQKEKLELFYAINDPIEPFNRTMSGFNQGFFRGFLYPVNQGYNFIFPKPVRRGLANMGTNLKYPVHMLNSLFQGKFKGAWNETKRFGVNTTVGVLGLWDPATKWNIKTSREDFGQTFGHYGGEPGFYLEIPFIGPCGARDGIGKLLDTPFDIGSWMAGARAFFTNNDLSFNNEALLKLYKYNPDTYAMMRNIWAMDRAKDVSDYQLQPFKGNPDESLGAIFLQPRDKDFFKKGKTRKVKVPHTGKKFPYTFWIQKEKAPLVLIIPGLGSHRTTSTNVALAEMAWENGYSVVVISSTMNIEFMEKAASVPLPGYAPADCQDIITVLDLIRTELRKKYEGRASSVAVMGLSLGAFHTLYISTMEQQGLTKGITFDRYLAINPPKSLLRGMNKLDGMFEAPLKWKAEEREQRMRETIYKAIVLGEGMPAPGGPVPLTRTESEFLIGIMFRKTLRDVIYQSQKRENLGILKNEISSFSRRKNYEEIREYDYNEYMLKFAVPYFLKKQSGEKVSKETLLQEIDLEGFESSLQKNDKVRVHINVNDFLLTKEDVDWFKECLGERLVEFPGGGHLGNLYVPEVQKQIMHSLSDLREL